MADDSAKLKSLERELSQLKRERCDTSDEYREVKRKIDHQEREIHTLTKKITALKKNNLVVTEHAIVRYLERVEGIDMEAIKERILPLDVLKKIRALKGSNATYPCDRGFSIRLQEGAVVTVIAK